MIKVFYVMMYSPFLLLFAEVPKEAASTPERWASFIMWVLLMIGIGVAAKQAFQSIWIKKGFEGLDEVLDSQEALQFLAAVMSYIFMEVFIGLHATEFSGLYPHADFKYYLTFSGCVGTGGFALFDKLMKNKMGNHIIDVFTKKKEDGRTG